jgi:O-antigen/teichoic acid export membrane protein
MSQGTRDKVLRGGVYISIRRSIGMVLSLVGALYLTRVIGPNQHGLYNSASSLLHYIQMLSTWGVAVQLIRSKDEPTKEMYDVAFTMLLMLGLAATLIGAVASFGVHLWLQHSKDALIFRSYIWVSLALFCGIVLDLIYRVPKAMLQRKLDYKKTTTIEIWSLILFYMVGITLAQFHYGAWAMVAGWWAQTAMTCVLFFKWTGYRPQLRWNRVIAKPMASYGITYSTSMWVYELKQLIKPLIVARFAGSAAVGYIAQASRIVELLAFAKEAGARLAVPAMARVQDDPKKVRDAVGEGMRLHVLGVGVFLVAFAFVGPWLVPLALGPRWVPMLDIYPFIALSVLAYAVSNLHRSVLQVYRMNNQVAFVHAVYVSLMIGLSLILVPKYGLIGYGIVEISAIPAYALFHLFTRRLIGSPQYSLAMLWYFALSAALFAPTYGWWLASGLLAILCLPATWSEVRRLWKDFSRLGKRGERRKLRDKQEKAEEASTEEV